LQTTTENKKEIKMRVIKKLLSIVILFLAVLVIGGLSLNHTNKVDDTLVGTWFHIKNDKVQYFQFNEDLSFELNYNNLIMSEKYFKEKGIDCSMKYYTDKTVSPKKLFLELRAITQDTTITLKMTGVYQIKNDSTLKIDLGIEEKNNFTEQTTIFHRTDNFEKVEIQNQGYVFTRIIKGMETRDTILKTDKKFEAIDTIYKNTVRPNE